MREINKNHARYVKIECVTRELLKVVCPARVIKILMEIFIAFKYHYVINNELQYVLHTRQNEIMNCL